MNKHNLIGICLAIFIAGCGGGGSSSDSSSDTETPQDNPPVTQLTISESQISGSILWGSSIDSATNSFEIDADGINWTLASTAEWLVPSVSSGSGDQTVSLAIGDWSQLSLGTNKAIITITDSTNAETEELTFELNAITPEFTASASNIELQGQLGHIPMEGILITTNAQTSFNWSVAEVEGLTFDKMQGPTGQQLNIGVDPKLSHGVYNRTIIIHAQLGSSILETEVSVDILADPHRVYVDRPGVALFRVGSLVNLNTQVELFDSFEQVTGNTQISTDESWLNASFANNLIDINVDDSNLSEGFYLGTLRVSNDAAGVHEDEVIYVGFYKQSEEIEDLQVEIAGHIYRLVPNPVYPHVYVSHSGSIDVVHQYTGQIIKTISSPDGESLKSLTVSSNGQTLYFGSNGDNFYQLDLALENAVWSEPVSFITSYFPTLLRPQGVPILMAVQNTSSQILNLETLELMNKNSSLPASYDPAIAVHRDQKSVANVDMNLSGHIRLSNTNINTKRASNNISMSSYNSLASSEYFSATNAINLKPDGSIVYVVSYGNKIQRFSFTSDGSFKLESNIGANVEELLVDSSGLLYASIPGSFYSSSYSGELLVYNDAGDLLDTYGVSTDEIISDRRNTIGISGDEQRLFIIYESKTSPNGVYIKTNRTAPTTNNKVYH